jgi:pyruvate kinase
LNKSQPTKNKIDILCTIGPGSDSPATLKKLEKSGMTHSRINMSHTSIGYCEDLLKNLKQNTTTPIIIDTQGPQIRTGPLKKKFVVLEENNELTLHTKEIIGDEKKMSIFPASIIDQLKEQDTLSIDFDSVIATIKSINRTTQEIICKIVNGGIVGSNKAVTLEFRKISLPILTEKDKLAIQLGIKNGITTFALSFVHTEEDVMEVRDFCKTLTSSSVYLIAKVETKDALEHLDNILDTADAILLDRGDLSREIGIEKIPFSQKIVLNRATKKNKKAIVATNLLESMITSSKPTRAEINDIANTLLDGALGLALCAETAIGQFPVEATHTLTKITKHTSSTLDNISSLSSTDKIIERLEELEYITKHDTQSLLIEPHGGKLINNVLEHVDEKYIKGLTKLKVSKEILMDAEQIAIGTYSPLEGFMTEKDLNSVLNNMRLTNNIIWPVPILLPIEEAFSKQLKKNDEIALTSQNNEIHAILQVQETYKINKEEVCKKLYGTTDIKHPGVKHLLSNSNIMLAGKVSLVKPLSSEFKQYELTPKQTRKIFDEKKWSRVVAFHTRNVIHRSHEFIQLYALDNESCDGLFVHPVVGKKKPGDFHADTIIKSYEIMIKEFYPKNKVVLGVFSTFSRYAGPREALFTAICRKNFGCSHFIVGRDHTGVGKFYHPHASHKIFDKFPDLGIKPILFDEVVYCVKCDAHTHNMSCKHDGKEVLKISGTQAREMFQLGKSPPDWFMRSKISEKITDMIKKGKNVFVE